VVHSPPHRHHLSRLIHDDRLASRDVGMLMSRSLGTTYYPAPSSIQPQRADPPFLEASSKCARGVLSPQALIENQRRPDVSAALHDIYTPGRPAYRRSSLSRSYSSESHLCAGWRLSMVTALHCHLVLMRLLLLCTTYIPRTVLRTADRPFPEAIVAKAIYALGGAYRW